MTATFIGNFLKSNLTIFSQITGIIIMTFGLNILFGKGFKGFNIKENRPNSYAGAFIFGAAIGLSWTPCIGPILVAILLLASTSSSVITGGMMMFIYAVGLALPLLIFSTYLGNINKNGKLWRFIRGKELQICLGKKIISIHTTSLISGLLFIILGYLIFSGELSAFNQYIGTSSFQKWIFSIEDKLFNFLKF
jgi:cytochrome c-type biogenesis protein